MPNIVSPNSTSSLVTPGGSNTQVQFNDSGSFGGDAGLTYNKTTDSLTAGNVYTPTGGTIGVSTSILNVGDATINGDGFFKNLIGLLDPSNNGYLFFDFTSNLTNNRTLTILTGDVDNTVDFRWFDQGVKTTSSPTFVSLNSSGLTVSTQITNNGAAQKDKNVVANSSTAYTIDQANGKSFEITLTANATLTLASAPTSGIEQDLIVDVIQDGTGGRTLTWGNVTEWVGVATPTYLTAAGSKTRYVFKGTSNGWVGCGIFQPTDTLNAGGISASTPGASSIAGRVNGGDASSGYVGEVISSTIAIGSAVSLTTATSKTITSISLTAGDWDVWANIGFIPAAGTIPTSFKGSIGQTNDTLDTAPNSGAYFESNITYPASLTQVFPVGRIRVNISYTTTIYLIGQSTFSVSTLTAYGALFARRAFS